MKPRVLIAHQVLAADASPSDLDVLDQVAVVKQACAAADWPCEVLEVSLDFHSAHERLQQGGFDVIFNLVESLAGSDQLAELFARLVETLGLPHTGSSADALRLSNDKIRTKELLKSSGLPTPDWRSRSRSGQPIAPLAAPYIVKAIGQHASLGLDDASVIRHNEQSVEDTIAWQSERVNATCFAEQFIEGREFNLSLIGPAQQPTVLPPAEIEFIDFPADKPRIVGYDAKWKADSHEFIGTPRTFDFPPQDQPLVVELKSLAIRTWHTMQLAGYARVDFRVDQNGRPFLLEVNTNPCLSPDAGFAAAVLQSGSTLDDAIQQIILAAITLALPVVNSIPTMSPKNDGMVLRSEVIPSDAVSVERIVRETGFFRPAEVAVAVELVEERLAKGAASGYEFYFAEIAGDVVGYACYGPISVTEGSYDLYWIAVDPRIQKRGIGRALLSAVESQVQAAGGRRIYIETSGKTEYAPTQQFYRRCGYQLEATLADFYLPGDDKLVFVRSIT